MRNRVRIALAVLLVALVGGIIWQALREREPVYQGKRLSVWLLPVLVQDAPEQAKEGCLEPVVNQCGSGLGVDGVASAALGRKSRLSGEIVFLRRNGEWMEPVQRSWTIR